MKKASVNVVLERFRLIGYHKRATILVFAAALGGCQGDPADDPLRSSLQALDSAEEEERCTWGLGYWKNHPGVWKVDTLALGSVTYQKDQLLAILHEPVGGNGLLSLAHQLIAAKLNVLSGADDVTGGALAYADTLIGSGVIPPIGTDSVATADTSAVTHVLEEFNQGRLEGVCHIEVCGDAIVDPGEQCDDGNLDDSDACVGACTHAVCGDGHLHAGLESCDDGNTDALDGCNCFPDDDNGDGYD